MFIHLFTYRFKTLMRDRSMVFWTLLFPIVLSTLFKLAFGNLATMDDFNAIKVAVVENSIYTEDTTFQAALESLSTGDSPMLEVVLADDEGARNLLKDGQVEGVIVLEGKEPKQKRLLVLDSGLEQSILKSFMDQYSQNQAGLMRLIEGQMKTDPAGMPALIQSFSDRFEFVDPKPISSAAKLDSTLNYFYSLLGMACMYGAFFGTNEVNNIQANISMHAARMNMAPVHKLKIFLYSGAAAYLVQVLEMFVLLAYMTLILKIDFGTRFGLIVVTTLVGSLVGVSFGAFISALVKGNEGLKLAITLSVAMVGSMLSGMMVAGIKYIIASRAPILLYINPVNLVTDSFYALYFFDDYSRYTMNILLLLGFAVVFSLGTYFAIRGRKYASL